MAAGETPAIQGAGGLTQHVGLIARPTSLLRALRWCII